MIRRDPKNPSGRYILGGPEGKTLVAEPDLMRWGRWLEQADRQVALTGNKQIRVSTVFLGLDHNFFGSGPPLLFETMIFGGPQDLYQERWATWEEAEAGHKAAVALAFGKALA